VCARAAGHARSVRYLRIDGDGRWKLSPAIPGAPGATSERGAGTPWLELALLPERTVRGRVLDPGGRPLAGVHVAAEGHVQVLAAVASRDHAEARTGSDGTFVLAGLHPGVTHTLTLMTPGLAHAPLALAPGLPGDGADTGGELVLGDLVLAPSALVAGAVVDADGAPIAGAEIVLRVRAASDGRGDDVAALDTASARAAREHRARTGSEGAFALEGFLPRPLTLTVEHAGAVAELELLPRADGSFDSPVITLFAPPVVAERAKP
jgi:hypothetical protein